MILLRSTGPTVYRFETERSVAGSTTLFNFMQHSDLLIISFRGHGARVIIRPLGTTVDFSYNTEKVTWRPFEGMFLFGALGTYTVLYKCDWLPCYYFYIFNDYTSIFHINKIYNKRVLILIHNLFLLGICNSFRTFGPSRNKQF